MEYSGLGGASAAARFHTEHLLPIDHLVGSRTAEHAARIGFGTAGGSIGGVRGRWTEGTIRFG